ncbi:hypothetical protein S7711_01625 [Stachybotrys chartarum IBT 7711]|uniref:Dynamin-type G domain-containing protein n=1 Tax=Stachybotrys chartarum (strain CBS 109288 / IBT 7711) TaxID=1280523 RepID=A0A084BCA3_STACB|nr:hypothetical protein S7711_01625 [Stachybotrys chartarum IBT 7711]
MTISSQDGDPAVNGQFNHLRSATSSYWLNQIEKIRANGVGDLVALPQLIVCGDQSTGKSSVLEGITGIPFPRQEGLSTRFSTEIILRHSEIETTTIVAKVRPHVSRSKKARQVLCAYREDIRDISELPRVVQDVSKLIDLRDGTKDSKGKAFSSDSLRIEVTGPIGLHLSIVDLPGLISVPGEEQSEEDIAVVAKTVKAYVKRSRTIILAVLQAGNDMANQMIIKIAKHYDPEGQRTVGIITKPDLINHEAIPIMTRIFQNKGTIKLKLGFYLVKDPIQTLNTMFTVTIRKAGNHAPPFVLPDEGENDEDAYEELTDEADAEEDEATVGSDKDQKRGSQAVYDEMD